MSLARHQREQIIAALGAPIVRQLIILLDAQGPSGPVVPPLINDTQLHMLLTPTILRLLMVC